MSNATDKCSMVEHNQNKRKITCEPNFIKSLADFSDNNDGQYFNGVYLPQEVVTLILTYLDGKDVLQTSLVCRKWFNIVRSNTYWHIKFNRQFNRKPKKVPWYVYYAYFNHGLFDRNLIRNGNGEKRYKHWNIVRVTGSVLKIEVPVGADSLPTNVEEFNGNTSCFVMSHLPSLVIQRIELAPLCRHIMTTHKPHIYVSEWVACNLDCTYIINCRLHKEGDGDVPPLAENIKYVAIEGEDARKWSKVDMVLCDYPEGVEEIIFQHVGRNFSGNDCKLKMAGSVVKILFDTVKEITDEDV